MAKDMFWTITTFLIIISVLALAFWPSDTNYVVVVKYDCRQLVDGLRLDIPVTVQEACSKKGAIK